ncbi:MAG: hypothetical protein HYY65_05060 [Candidatus Tectomicrobia bacterium]|uniref:Uncharacterized protein n=1 Tax=Tectimicrobiota bacterium TaxID=2528274 RepID=A0A932GNQ9_UNCTE|nr:hypothetical protein [Candidatus Tectomicrobia bacterium]
MRFRWVTLALALSLSSGCASVPPQIAQTHKKELEIINSLQQSHTAMVDAYVDQKISVFESFFFKNYGPAYLKHWRVAFKAAYGRDYDENRDFQLLYSDLVAEYQTEIAPIENIRKDLRDAISREYRHAIAAHEAVGGWINSLEKLDAAHREAIGRLLDAVNPGLSLDSVEKAVDKAIEKAKEKISGLSN